MPRIPGILHRALPGLALFLLLPALALAAGQETTVDGVLHVRNGAQPSQGVQTYHLRELWRAGGDDEEGAFFGLITQVVVDDAGDIYLLDTQLSQVYVYSPTGELLKTLSREGEGPGETQRPSDLLFMPDGSLGLVQTFPGKVVEIDRDGNPAGVFQPASMDPAQGGFSVVVDVNAAGGNLVLGGMEISQSPEGQVRNNYLASFDAAGQQKARYCEKSVRWEWANLVISEKDQDFCHFRRWDVGPDGRVYAATQRNQYTIQVFLPDGALDRVIERTYTSLARSDEDSRRINALMDATKNRFPPQLNVKMEVESTEPDVRSLRVAADGRLWVLSSRGYRDQPEGIMETYDVYDPAGHFVQQVAIACNGDGQQDGLFFASEKLAVRVTGFWDALLSLQAGGALDLGEEGEATPMEVICYAIE
jgi:hypothetical protein